MIEVKMSVKCDHCGKEAEIAIPIADKSEVREVVYSLMLEHGFTPYYGSFTGLPEKKAKAKALCKDCSMAFARKREALASEFMGGGK